MYSKCDFKVTLMNPEEVKNFVENHGEFACVCYDTPEKYAKRVGKSVLTDSHFSGSRGDFFKFKIQVIPRYTADQMMRHEVGVYKNCQSQRYVDKHGFGLYADEFIQNDEYLLMLFENVEHYLQERYEVAKNYIEVKYPYMKAEQINDHIRGLIPIGADCQLNIGFTLEALINFMNKRLCLRADDPIRKVANLMKDAVLEVAPIYAEYFVPQCDRLMYCPEKHSCGRCARTKQDLINILENYNKEVK